MKAFDRCLAFLDEALANQHEKEEKLFEAMQEASQPEYWAEQNPNDWISDEDALIQASRFNVASVAAPKWNTPNDVEVT